MTKTQDAQDSTTNSNDFYFLVADGSLEYASFFGEKAVVAKPVGKINAVL